MAALLCIFSVSALKSQSKLLPHHLQIFSKPISQRSYYKSNISTSSKSYIVKMTHHNLQIINNTPDLIMRRRLDNDYYVVSSLNDDKHLMIAASKGSLWSANNLWKLADPLRLQKVVDLEEVATFYIHLDKAIRHDNLPSVFQQPIYEHKDHHIYKVRVSFNQMFTTLVNINAVSYIGIEANEVSTESRVLDLNLNPNTINLIHHEYPILNGNGMVLSLQELGFDTTDIDLKNRSIKSILTPSETGDHATDMATIAAGAGNSFINGKGVAWSANITSSNFNEILPDKDIDYKNLDVSVQNHSYGTTIENFYGAKAMAFDLSANNNPNLLHVFSIGNKGEVTTTEGRYANIPGLANITGNFKMSKNSLSVGSVDTTGNPIAFVSKGPAFDGRIKPELVSYSTAGSSNSAAMVSGLAILLQQQHKLTNATFANASLIKSLLINSANDVHTKGPDYITGYGNVDGYRTVKNLISNQFWEGEVETNGIKSLEIDIPENAIKLKVTLVWNDPAAQANSNIALINDLDLTLENNGNVWLPWVLNDNPSTKDILLEATRKEDHLNNVEQISIDLPEKGIYTIKVSGFNVPEGPQNFSVAYQWDEKEEFQWTFPTSSDHMPYDGETGTYFRWQSTLSGNTGRLEISFDDGVNWEIIRSDIRLDQGYFRWDPARRQGIARARMVVGTNVFETGSFSISPTPNLGVGFNCEDSVLLQWNHIEQAESYDIFITEEGNPFQTNILNTADSAVVIKKSDYSSRRFAVQAKSSNGTRFLKTPLINYEFVGNSCYLQSFFVTVDANIGNNLFLQIGTTYNVKEITFSRKENGIYVPLENVTSNLSTTMEFVDRLPIQGLNTYQATITLNNGEQILSNEINAYFLTTVPYLVFPNPVANRQPITIIASEFGESAVTITLTNQSGQVVMEKTLEEEIAQLQTINLKPGMYFYKIKYSQGFVSGKLVIL